MDLTWSYPVELRWEEGRYHAYASGEPAAMASGASVEAALDGMTKSLTALAYFAMANGEHLSLPSPATRAETYRVVLPARLAAKASLHVLRHLSGLGEEALAARLGCPVAQVRQILDPDHATEIEAIEAAARALGGRITVGFAAG
ncbi:conserved hypothetical protein [Methylobacterium sp. 4-46]|uniref:hypothetical protein n=1 Tax=unclassified Methylobacterium TaxID=2615210 RepID=UPI000165CBAD|nr:MULTISPECIES: hypothetical protein [Methylobacterium]ACA20267.1 conserved hypothetical protein [Methylobacterium sp. 4-46]WFT79444.1 hypothetical protein QA634_30230 [Methylobacterium nodulans]